MKFLLDKNNPLKHQLVVEGHDVSGFPTPTDEVGKFNPTIIFSNTGNGKLADRMRREGFRVLGASTFSDDLALNEPYNRAVISRYGIELAEPEDEGVLLTVEAWFNGLSFIHPVRSMLKRTRLMNDDVGPEGESMGELSWFYKSKSPRAFTETLKKLESLLIKARYVGPISVETLATANGTKSVKLVPQLSSVPTFIEGMRGNVGEFLEGIARGTVKELRASWDWIIGVTVLGSPSEELHLPHFYPTTNSFAVTARAGAIDQARKTVYNRIKRLTIQDLQYRTDIGKRGAKDLKKLKDWDYI